LLNQDDSSYNQEDSTFLDQYDVTESQLDNFNEVPQLDQLQSTDQTLTDLTAETLNAMYNNYRFKEGESLSAEISDQGYL